MLEVIVEHAYTELVIGSLERCLIVWPLEQQLPAA
jgi:hypothetical protein